MATSCYHPTDQMSSGLPGCGGLPTPRGNFFFNTASRDFQSSALTYAPDIRRSPVNAERPCITRQLSITAVSVALKPILTNNGAGCELHPVLCIFTSAEHFPLACSLVPPFHFFGPPSNAENTTVLIVPADLDELAVAVMTENRLTDDRPKKGSFRTRCMRWDA